MDYRPGQLVRSLSGRDKGLYCVVVDTAQGRTLVADGALHRLHKPKAKNPRHLAPTNRFVSAQALASDKLLIQAIAELTAPSAIS